MAPQARVKSPTSHEDRRARRAAKRNGPTNQVRRVRGSEQSEDGRARSRENRASFAGKPATNRGTVRRARDRPATAAPLGGLETLGSSRLYFGLALDVH